MRNQSYLYRPAKHTCPAPRGAHDPSFPVSSGFTLGGVGDRSRKGRHRGRSCESADNTATAPPTQTYRYNKIGVADNTIIIAHFANTNPDCTASGKTFVRVSRSPSHGVVTMREGFGFSHFPKTPECNSHKIQGVTVEYIPERGFTGSDDFELDVIYQVGTEALVTYDITIKPWDFSDTLSTDDFLKEKEWARGDSLRMRNDDTHAVSTKQNSVASG